MRRAFTLIELIFVVILVGILGAVGSSLYRPDRVLADTNYIAAKLMQSRYEAIGYDHRNFDGTFDSSSIGCITISKSSLNDPPQRAGGYTLSKKSLVTVSGLTGNTICFDEKGYPHDGNFFDSSLLHRRVDINVSDSKNSYTITVMPFSGYVKILN